MNSACLLRWIEPGRWFALGLVFAGAARGDVTLPSLFSDHMLLPAGNPQFSLWNGAGLPAGPFRTDDWIDDVEDPATSLQSTAASR